MGVWGSCPSGVRGLWPQKLTTLLCENVLFCHGFKNNIAVFAFIAYTYVQYEVEGKLTWRQKSARASNSVCPLGTKSVWGLSALFSRLHRQWT